MASRSTPLRLLLPLTSLAAAISAPEGEEEASKGCTITAKTCRNFPEFQRAQFRDDVGESHLQVGNNDAACMKRAEDFHYWCGNRIEDGAQVAATYNPGKVSQIFHPGACEKGWSQWDAFCYKHYWEKKNWFDAERLCRERNSHLASIHSKAENRFIYTLTSGLSAWIGYSDLDQDTHYKWSDSTQDDFSNFAKNCSGRESDPDCQPEETKQQWYDWQGGDEGTFVCKRNALLPVGLLRNSTSGTMTLKAWEELMPALLAAKQGGLSAANASMAATLPDLKTPEMPLADEAKAEASAKKLESGKPHAAPEPRLFTPKGSLL
jgi:hypothetical protein